jgi:aminoglycoside 3-N-acetyltransferase
LEKLEIPQGCVLVVSADLGQLGFIQDFPRKQETLSKYLEAIREAVGPEGTLVMPTFSYGYAGKSAPFILESTSSETGTLSEFFRQQKGVLRSLHPIFSYTAQGPLQESMCGNVSRNSFGANTPLARTLTHDAIGLSLGIHPIESTSIHHHAEHLIGVPYRYHKRFDTPVYKDGVLVPGEFFAYLRFKNADIEKDSSRYLKRLESNNLIRSVKVDNVNLFTYRYRHVFSQAVELLMDDIYGLLKRPPNLPSID